MNPDRPNRVPEIKSALSDPTRVLDALGILGEGRARRRQAAGWIVCCPVHGDRTPSCSVQHRNGELVWNCHGCGAGGDVLSLVAAVRGTSMRGPGFVDTLVESARLGGLWHVVDEIEGRAIEADRRMQPAPVRQPVALEHVREWPPLAEVDALWRACGPISGHEEASRYLGGRGIDADRVDALELGRALPERGALPRWASYRGDAPVSRTWRELGYLLMVPMYDHTGSMRSVRAWRVRPGDGPKRLPPSGHRASGLVMADTFGRAMLSGARAPDVVVIVEGEPSFLSRCLVTRDPRVAVIGVVSGSWTPAFAGRFPIGCRVSIRTDQDNAGDRYAEEIRRSLGRRCLLFRLREGAA